MYKRQGQGYRYAHNEEGAYAAGENYWPDDLAPRPYYDPTSQGLEAKIRERLARLRQIDDDARRNG